MLLPSKCCCCGHFSATSLIDMIVIVRLSSPLLKFRRLFILPSFFCKEKHRKSEEHELFALQGKAVLFAFGSAHHNGR
jgi:hypothetical protein